MSRAAGGKFGVQLWPAVLVAEQPLRPRHDMRQMPAGYRWTRINRNDAHAMAHALAAEALGEHIECDVAGAPRDIAVIRLTGRRTHNVDDDAALSFTHARIDDAR